jgi:hypothetical protein
MCGPFLFSHRNEETFIFRTNRISACLYLPSTMVCYRAMIYRTLRHLLHSPYRLEICMIFVHCHSFLCRKDVPFCVLKLSLGLYLCECTELLLVYIIIILTCHEQHPNFHCLHNHIGKAIICQYLSFQSSSDTYSSLSSYIILWCDAYISNGFCVNFLKRFFSPTKGC